jgi:hypothetical protein
MVSKPCQYIPDNMLCLKKMEIKQWKERFEDTKGVIRSRKTKKDSQQCPTRFLYPMMFVTFNSNTTGVTCGAGTAYPSGTPEFTPDFSVLHLKMKDHNSVQYLSIVLVYYRIKFP